MNIKTVYILYKFSGINNVIFADDKKFYNPSNLKEYCIRHKNGRNGIYIDRKFISLINLRENRYKHRELLKEKIDYSDCPF